MSAAVNDRLPISAIILTYNEEANIEACLRSICDWAGEIWVVDSGSTDATLEIIKRYTPLAVSHPFENYAHQRNWAQTNLPLVHDWVFHLDAGEQVTPELASQIADVFKNGSPQGVNGFLVRRRIVFMGRWIRHGGLYPIYHLRLFRRSTGRCEEREYDQHFLASGPVRRLDADLVDITASDLDAWTQQHNRWAGAEATHLLSQDARTKGNMVQGRIMGTPIEQRRWLRTRLYERSPLFLRALAYFLYRYILRLGFLDGVEGLIYHVLQGFWYRFYVDAKLYEMQQIGRSDRR